MRLGFRAASGAALALALFAGDLTTLSLTPAAASAQSHGGGFHGGGGGFHGGGGGFHGGDHDGYHGGGGGFHGGDHDGYRGGYGGYRGGYRGYGGFGYGGFGYGGYGGYYGGFGLGDALLGAAVIGGTAAIIASNNEPVYEAPYPVYQTYPPVYAPAYAPPAYAPGYVPPAYAPGYAPPAVYGAAPPPAAYSNPSHDPVEQCSRAAVSEAVSHGDSGRILSIDRVDGHENGAQVLGTLEVHRADRNAAHGSVERARFTCSTDYGQVTAFRFG